MPHSFGISLTGGSSRCISSETFSSTVARRSLSLLLRNQELTGWRSSHEVRTAVVHTVIGWSP